MAALAAGFILMVGSAWFDSPTFDEPGHLVHGFENLLGDYRLPPQHPPLFELIAAAGAEAMLRPAFPTGKIYVQSHDPKDVRVEGDAFLFSVGNAAGRVLFWARMPIMIASIVLAAIIFLFAEAQFDRGTALMATLMYVFSPTVMAHSRYVTTDLAATFGFAIAIFSYIRFLERPSRNRTLLAGIAFGIALLSKFSTILLFALYPIFLAEWLAVDAPPQGSWPRGDARALIAKSAAIGAIGFAVVWGVYAWLMRNYPIAEGLPRTAGLLREFNCPAWFASLITLASGAPLLRPFGEYLLGIAITYSHVANGQGPAYFMGLTSRSVSHLYFPILYFFKEPLPTHLMALIAVFTVLMFISRARDDPQLISRGLMRRHFAELAMATFVLLYWVIALRSDLTIGIRHILPAFPFIYLLVARRLSVWSGYSRPAAPAPLAEAPSPPPSSMRWRRLMLGGLFAWLIAESVSVYPQYLCYYNELAGGPLNGHWYAAESNYDWGQDYRRFHWFVRDRGIQRIAIAAFDSASLRHYLGDAYVPWKMEWGPPHGWFAVSTSWRDKFTGQWETENGGRQYIFPWLRDATPVERAGYCFWLYKFP